MAQAEYASPHHHGDTWYVPARTVHIFAEPGTWPVEVSIFQDVPVPLLLGRDWRGFDQVLTTAVPPTVTSCKRRRRRRRRLTTILLATNSEWEGESQPANLPNIFADLFQQVTAGGSFGRKQQEDEQLCNYWEQVWQVDNEERFLAPHPLPHFVIKNGLLYCVGGRKNCY